VNIIGVVGKIDSIDQMTETLRRFEASHNCTVQIFRADRIFGELHLEVAVEHAQRSFDQSRNRSKHIGIEILLYCAAERQIKNAIELLGITDETREMAIVILGEVPEKELLKSLGLERDDSVLDGNKEPEAFGITLDEVNAVGDDRVIDLILERMALSELDR
jgi:KEOPS complex subunit Cgi121